ncbi:MAG: PHP domain-containing protein [Coprobacter sp.]
MDNLTNYHTHSSYCDGSASIEDFVKEAVRQGFSSYGVSSHSPIPFDSCWNMNRDDLPAYLDEVHFIKKKYEGRIEIYCGLGDYLGRSDTSSSFFRSAVGLPNDLSIFGDKEGYVDIDTAPEI